MTSSVLFALMAEQGKDIEPLVQALSHDKRRLIIALLAEEGPKGVTELKSRLSLSTGSLYHNLEFLEGFIDREGKKYKLNERGMELYRMMREGTLNPPFAGISVVRTLMPVDYMETLLDNPRIAIPLACLMSLVIFASALLRGYGLVLLVLAGPWPERMFSAMSVALSLAIIISSTTMIFRSVNIKDLLILTLISLMPQALYSIVADYIYTFGTPVSDAIYLLVAGLGILTTASAVRVVSRTRTEYALLFSFVLVYLGAVLAPVISTFLAGG